MSNKNSRRFPWNISLWLSWVLASAAGFLAFAFIEWVSGGMNAWGGAFEAVAENAFDEWLIFFLIPGGFSIVSGITIGSMQRLVLRSRIMRANNWVWATALGAFLASLVGSAMTLAPISPARMEFWFIIQFSVGGTLVGTSQWLVLRSQVSRASIWIVATGAAYGASAWTALRTTGMFDIGGTAVGSLVYGGITGAAMVLLLSESDPEISSTKEPA